MPTIKRAGQAAVLAARRGDDSSARSAGFDNASQARQDGLVNPLTDLIGYHLRLASNVLVSDLAARLALLELTPAKGSILLLIRENPGVTQVQLSRILAIKRANMVPLITALDKQDLILRTRVDGRSQGLELTDKGRERALLAERSIHEHEAQFRAKLSPGAADLLLGELARLWEEETSESPEED